MNDGGENCFVDVSTEYFYGFWECTTCYWKFGGCSKLDDEKWDNCCVCLRVCVKKSRINKKNLKSF